MLRYLLLREIFKLLEKREIIEDIKCELLEQPRLKGWAPKAFELDIKKIRKQARKFK